MTELFDLSGRVALITGSSRGIGRAIAEAMAAHGARVVISSRKQEACDTVAAAINARHGERRTIAIAASISSKDALRHLVDETGRRVGPIDVLVCNAASNPYYGPMAGISDEPLRKILDNNIVSNHWLIGMVAPGMIERRDGAVIVISSIAGLGGSEALGAYAISKAADFQLVRNLAVEYGRHNLRVKCDRARCHPHRFRARAVGESGSGGGAEPDQPDAADRRAGRDRGGGGVSRGGRRIVRERPGGRCRWRRHDLEGAVIFPAAWDST